MKTRDFTVLRALEKTAALVVKVQGTPAKEPIRPGIVFLGIFFLFYIGHGVAIFLNSVWVTLPEFALYTHFWLCMLMLFFWPFLIFTGAPYILILGYLVIGVVCSYLAAECSVENWDWQEKQERAEREGRQALIAADVAAKEAYKEQGVKLAGALTDLRETEGQLQATQGLVRDEKERNAAAEAELRRLLAEAAQRERLLIFQRDASDQGPPLRRYDEKEPTLEQRRRNESSDPIDEIYGA